MTTSVNSRASNRKEFQQKLKGLSLTPGSKVGVLLLHGLTGMPNEMRSIAKALESIGCVVSVPLLPGHGGTHEELLDTGWKDWTAGARQALNELDKKVDQLFIGGLSMGALMPVLLATENPKVCGIVALSPTIKYDSTSSANPFKCLLPLVDLLPFLGRICYWTEEPPYGVKDERLQKIITKELEAAKRGEKTGFGQYRTYAGSLRQLQHLVGQVKKQAHKVSCPVLIMHSREDTITSVANPEKFYSWLGCTDKEIIYLTGCDHVLPLDLKRDEVAYHFASFVCRVSAAVAAR